MSLVKHGGGVKAWTCFEASGPGQLSIIDGTKSSKLYLQILKEHIRTSKCEEKLGHAAR